MLNISGEKSLDIVNNENILKFFEHNNKENITLLKYLQDWVPPEPNGMLKLYVKVQQKILHTSN